jgi:hypothetical protein
VQALVVAGARVVQVLNTEIWPYWSAMVLNTWATGSPSGSGLTSMVRLPAVTSAGGRSRGDGPISQMKSARRSTAMSAAAEPHTTGNTWALSTPTARMRSSSATLGMSPSR